MDERNPVVLKPNRSENSLSPLNEMQFTNGVPMNERNPAELEPNRSENSLSPLNEMQFTNGVPIECQVTLLVPIAPLVPMDERNPAVLKPNRSENSLSPLNEMQFSNGVPMESKSFHWYQWTNGIRLYSNRTVAKIV